MRCVARRQATVGRHAGDNPKVASPLVENPEVPGWIVRRVQPYEARKPYRCPGCDQEVGVGVGHIVAWPEDDIESRRHWHAACWAARDRRRPRPQRSRTAPRY